MKTSSIFLCVVLCMAYFVHVQAIVAGGNNMWEKGDYESKRAVSQVYMARTMCNRAREFTDPCLVDFHAVPKYLYYYC